MSSLSKRFFNDSVIYSLQPLLTKVFSYFLIPLYTAYLSPADFGNLNYILAFGNFFRNIVEMGLYSSFWKFKSKSSGYDLYEVIYNVNMMQFLVAINILLIMFIGKEIFFAKSLLGSLILLHLIGQTIFIVFQSSILVYRAKFLPKKYLLSTLFSTLLLLGLNILFVAGLKFNYKGVIYSYIICYSILALFFFRVSGKHFGRRLNKPLIKEALSYGFPIMIGNLASLMISMSPRFFLKEYASDYELGLFSFGFKFGELYHLLLANTFFMAWNALRWEIYEAPNGKSIFARFYKYVLIIFPLFGTLIIPALYVVAFSVTVDQEYLQGLKIMPLIVLSYVLQGMYYFNIMGLLFEAKTKTIMYIVVFGGLLNLIFNFILIRPLGMFGASISTFIAYFAMFLVGKYHSNRVYPIDRDKRMEIFQLFLIVLLAGIYTILFIITENKMIILSVSASLFIMIGGSYFIFGILKYKEIKPILNKMKFVKRKPVNNNQND